MKLLLLLVCLLSPVGAWAGTATESESSTSSAMTAVDLLVRTGATFVKFMTCMANDAASVAGTIELRDAVAAAGGTVKATWTVLAIDYSVSSPKVFPIYQTFTTGVFIDFTTTTDVTCWVAYK